MRGRLQISSSDIFAGTAVAAIEIPTALAYAQLAGFAPVVGLYASIFPLIAYAAVGSSRQLIVGPDAATCAMVAAALVDSAGGDPVRYLNLSITLSLVVGGLCIIGGILRLGALANLLSRPILVGFLNGIALTIVTSQFGKICGISVRTDTGLFLRLGDFASKLNGIHLPTFLVGIATLLSILLMARFSRIVPGALVGVAAGITMMTTLHLKTWAVASVGSVPAGLPWPHFPPNFWAEAIRLLPDASGIALICFCSSMPTAKSFALRNGYEVDANRELLAIGAANLASGMSQGFAVAGADSRTAVNVQAGGRSQVSGIIAAIVMGLLLAFGTGPLESIPVASLGAILILAGAGLCDFRTLRRIYDTNRWEFLLSAVATLGVATVGVLPGVVLAVALSIILLLVRASTPYDAVLGQVPGLDGLADMSEFSDARAIPGILVYRFDAALLFFNSEYFKRRVRENLARSQPPPQHFIFDMEAVNSIDVTGIESLEEVRSELTGRGIDLTIARAKLKVRNCLSRAGLLERIGVENFHESVRTAVRACSARPDTTAAGDWLLTSETEHI